MAKFKIFVINLDKRPDKLEFVKAQLDKLGLDFERIAGVDGLNLTEDEIAKAYSPKKNRKEYVRPLHRGQIGCYLAHVRVWRAIVEQNLDFGVILEDDVYIKDTLKPAIGALEDAYPNWGLVRLEENSKPKKIFSEKKISDGFGLATYINTPGGTRSMALTRAAAKAMLENLLPFGVPVDIQQQYLYKIGVKVSAMRPPSTHNGEVGLNSDLRSAAKGQFPRHYPFCRQVLSVSFYAGRLRRLCKEYGSFGCFKNLVKMCFKKPVA